MIQLVNEILNLIAQLASVMFSVGIAVYALQYPILRNGAKILPKLVAESQHPRLRRKVMRLFLSGGVTVFYAIVGKVIISQIALTTCILWMLLIIAIILLSLVFIFLFNLLTEVNLREDEN